MANEGEFALSILSGFAQGASQGIQRRKDRELKERELGIRQQAAESKTKIDIARKEAVTAKVGEATAKLGLAGAGKIEQISGRISGELNPLLEGAIQNFRTARSARSRRESKSELLVALGQREAAEANLQNAAKASGLPLRKQRNIRVRFLAEPAFAGVRDAAGLRKAIDEIEPFVEQGILTEEQLAEFVKEIASEAGIELGGPAQEILPEEPEIEETTGGRARIPSLGSL